MPDNEWQYQGKRRAQVAYSVRAATICFVLMWLLLLIGACGKKHTPLEPVEKAIRHTGRMDTLWVTP
jgi:hypothetical protein